MPPSSLNLFPVHVTLDGVEVRTARLHVEDGRLRVFQGTRVGKVELVTELSGVASMTRRGRTTVIEFDNGSTVEAVRASGCGCGHPLKSFNPRTWVAA